MNLTTEDFREDSVTSSDGTVISYQILGHGPGLVIVHGAFRASGHYVKLAKALSSWFTVYIVDRRGRGHSGAIGDDYSIHKECEDVLALREKHDIPFIFGHSFGGIVALQMGMQFPFRSIALYEPPLTINKSFPSEWLIRFEQELEQKDYVSASVTFLKGLQMGGILGKLPKPILKLLFRPMTKDPDWEENVQLLKTIPSEVRAVLTLRHSAESYKYISAPIMMMLGTKSPRYLHDASYALGEILPDSKIVSLKGFDHNAPDEKYPDQIAEYITEFFLNEV